MRNGCRNHLPVRSSTVSIFGHSELALPNDNKSMKITLAKRRSRTNEKVQRYRYVLESNDIVLC